MSAVAASAQSDLNRAIGAFTANIVSRHPDLGMTIERALVQRVQEVLAKVADATGSDLYRAQGECQALAGILLGVLES